MIDTPRGQRRPTEDAPEFAQRNRAARARSHTPSRTQSMARGAVALLALAPVARVAADACNPFNRFHNDAYATWDDSQSWSSALPAYVVDNRLVCSRRRMAFDCGSTRGVLYCDSGRKSAEQHLRGACPSFAQREMLPQALPLRLYDGSNFLRLYDAALFFEAPGAPPEVQNRLEALAHAARRARTYRRNRIFALTTWAAGTITTYCVSVAFFQAPAGEPGARPILATGVGVLVGTALVLPALLTGLLA